MKKLSYYLKQHIPGYLFAILSMVIAVSLDLLTPQVTRHIVDDVLVGGQMGKLKYLLLAILLIGIGRCIFQYTKEFTFDKISSTIATDMRRDLFAHIQSLSADFFDKTSTGELMARVKANIRRRSMEYASAQASGTANTVEANGLCLNPETYQVTKNGAPVDLTQKEYDLLSYLIRERGKVFSREDLMQRVWNYDYYGDMRTVDVTVRRLREKIEDDPGKPRYILTRRGVGYYFAG